jgi:O-antigen/teichoic acid export membrane protein
VSAGPPESLSGAPRSRAARKDGLRRIAGDFRGERRAVFALTATEAAARLLGLAFYLVAARSFSVSGFGVVRYTITLALLALAPLLVLATATNRELGAARGGETRTRLVLGSSLAIGSWVWLGTAALCVAASAAGLTGNADLTGLLVVLAGLGMFNLYYQVSRGLGHLKRIAVAYVGGSLLQLGVFSALVVTTDLSPTAALVIFGISSGIAVIGCELVAPVVRGRGVFYSREGAGALWRIGAPLIVTQAGFIIWFSADQIWVDSTLGAAQIGLYGAAKTLIQAFFVLIAGSNGVVMPRIAELRTAGHDARARRFIFVMVLRLGAFAVVAAALIIAARSPLLTVLFGDSYDQAADALVALTLGMAVYATFVAITMSAIGWGRPGVSALGYTVAALSEVALLLFAGGSAIAFAGWVNAISIALGLAAVVVVLTLRPLR